MKLDSCEIRSKVSRAAGALFDALNDADLLCRYREGATNTTLCVIESHLFQMLLDMGIIVPADVEPVTMDTKQLAEVTDVTA